MQSSPRCPDDKKDAGPLGKMRITHGHYDHTRDAVEIGHATIAQAVAETVANLGTKGIEDAAPMNKNTAPMNKGGMLAADGLKITMAPGY